MKVNVLIILFPNENQIGGKRSGNTRNYTNIVITFEIAALSKPVVKSRIWHIRQKEATLKISSMYISFTKIYIDNINKKQHIFSRNMIHKPVYTMASWKIYLIHWIKFWLLVKNYENKVSSAGIALTMRIPLEIEKNTSKKNRILYFYLWKNFISETGC